MMSQGLCSGLFLIVCGEDKKQAEVHQSEANWNNFRKMLDVEDQEKCLHARDEAGGPHWMLVILRH